MGNTKKIRNSLYCDKCGGKRIYSLKRDDGSIIWICKKCKNFEMYDAPFSSMIHKIYYAWKRKEIVLPEVIEKEISALLPYDRYNEKNKENCVCAELRKIPILKDVKCYICGKGDETLVQLEQERRIKGMDNQIIMAMTDEERGNIELHDDLKELDEKIKVFRSKTTLLDKSIEQNDIDAFFHMEGQLGDFLNQREADFIDYQDIHEFLKGQFLFMKKHLQTGYQAKGTEK